RLSYCICLAIAYSEGYVNLPPWPKKEYHDIFAAGSARQGCPAEGGFLQMEALLPKFELNPPTWVYITSIALVGFFFKFNRLMSVRNLDLAALIGLAPGLLLVSYGRGSASQGIEPNATIEASGFFVLLGVGLFFLGRLIADLFMTRRPLLE